MIRALYISASAMITQEAKQNITTNNLANANTNGFKSDNLAVKSFGDYMLSNMDKKDGNKNVRNDLGTLSFGSKIDEVSASYTQGTLQDTGKSTDFAIQGRGFFVVQKSDGISKTDYYTRDGEFHVNSNGYLVSNSGYYVLGKDLNTNDVKPILIGDNKFKADSFGNITLGLDSKPSIKLNTVDFKANDNNQANDYKALDKVGDNLFTVNPNPKIKNTLIADEKINIVQSSLEKSNVNIINEMSNMMTNMRIYETNQKIIQTIDETLSKAVNEVGSVR